MFDTVLYMTLTSAIFWPHISCNICHVISQCDIYCIVSQCDICHMVGLYLYDTCHIVDPWFMSHLPHCRPMIHVTFATWSSNSCDTFVFRIVDPWLMQHLSLCGSIVNMTLATTTLQALKPYGVTLWIQESCDTCHNYTAGPKIVWCHIVNPGVLWHLPQCLC